VAAELTRVLSDEFDVESSDFKLAVVGLRVDSEHEDSCCVTIDLSGKAIGRQQELEAGFQERAGKKVSKGARPDYLRFGKIPVSFKGAVLYPELKKDFKKQLEEKGVKLYD
jgi:hypothetical protein